MILKFYRHYNFYKISSVPSSTQLTKDTNSSIFQVFLTATTEFLRQVKHKMWCIYSWTMPSFSVQQTEPSSFLFSSRWTCSLSLFCPSDTVANSLYRAFLTPHQQGFCLLSLRISLCASNTSHFCIHFHPVPRSVVSFSDKLMSSRSIRAFGRSFGGAFILSFATATRRANSSSSPPLRYWLVKTSSFQACNKQQELTSPKTYSESHQSAQSPSG